MLTFLKNKLFLRKVQSLSDKLCIVFELVSNSIAFPARDLHQLSTWFGHFRNVESDARCKCRGCEMRRAVNAWGGEIPVDQMLRPCVSRPSADTLSSLWGADDVPGEGEADDEQAVGMDGLDAGVSVARGLS